MADSLTPADRSALMAKVKSAGNRSTEMKAEAALVAADIGGWEQHAALPGKPDFYFPEYRLAVFIDGCFWHGCPKHVRYPQAHADYWRSKIERNRKRDERIRRQLRSEGFHVMRVWEHDLRRDTWLKRLRAMLRKIEGHAHSGNAP